MATFSVPRGEPVLAREDCSPFDIGLVYESIGRFSDAQKFQFIQNLWKPDAKFNFPKSIESCGKLRKFQYGWLLDHPWLAYSQYFDAAFCVPCVCFGFECGKNGDRLMKLVKSPLTFWTTSALRLRKHSRGKCETHNYSVITMAGFMANMKRETVPIDQQLNRQIQQQIDENREKIKSIVKTVIFCGQHNFALRGRRDDDVDDTTLTGNFQALLDFRVDSGDTKLKEHFENAPRNATYRSKTIQNEMIVTVGKYILSKISSEIKAAKFFAILADEAADISNKEHLSLVLRFVDSANNIREEFIGFYLCENGTTGEAVSNMIMKAIEEQGLSMNDCRGQSYDGAGNMAGKYQGAATRLQGQFSKALYVHCMSHRLNLCVADTCSLPMVRNMMGTIRKLSDFFHNAPKRQALLVKKIKTLLPDSNHTVLINVCRTRWVARLDGFDRVVELLVPVVATLDDIGLNNNDEGDVGGGNWSADSRNDAQALGNAITFSFVVTLVIVRYILDLTRPVTVKLQRKEMDLLKAEQEISLLKKNLEDLRTNVDLKHHELYLEAVQLANAVGLEPNRPRVVQRQIHRDNLPTADIESYYRANLTVVFLDHSLQQLEARFPPMTYRCYQGISIVPSILLANLAGWRAAVQIFCHHYSLDIPNVAGLSAELDLWENMWREKKEEGGEIPDRVSTTLKLVDQASFPNIHTILVILATIPVTSCSCERSISSLRLLKNYLRNTMGQSRLNGLALMHAHKSLPLDLNQIIDLFASLHPRRMRMANILDSDE